MLQDNPYQPPTDPPEEPLQGSPKLAPAPQVSGKLAALLLPLAVIVFAWTTGASWIFVGVVCLTTIGFGWLLLLYVNRKDKPRPPTSFQGNAPSRQLEFCATCGCDMEIDEDNRCVQCGYTV